MKQWTLEQAAAWREKQGLIFGCNFLPSTAVNSTDMWQPESFDPVTIKRELYFASGIGLNSVRVFMPYIVWRADRDGFVQRMELFLSIANDAGLSMMPILFDDCAFSGREPFLGIQPAPVTGVHNSQWTPSPGFSVADDNAAWPGLEEYVKSLISIFGNDPRVLIWDLYNEPGNSNRGVRSLPLLEAAFGWAREAGGAQPLTAGGWSWTKEQNTVSEFCVEWSDIVSFHCYEPQCTTKNLIENLSKYRRPLLCTEWLHRPMGSRPETHLPLFLDCDVGSYSWGLVVGKTQTNLNWETMAGTPNPEPDEWQHDLMTPDAAVYSQSEIAAIRTHLGRDLVMTPVDMTTELMHDLEERDLIIRLAPGNHELRTPPAETVAKSVYESEDRFGPHKLIAVSVNREEFAGFGTHPDNEEFLLIGNSGTKPLYLAVALCQRDEFEEKIQRGLLRPSDLVLIRCRYNDPEVSFFVMRRNVPHGEAVTAADLPPATFYVTESRDLPLDLIEMRKYRLRVATI